MPEHVIWRDGKRYVLDSDEPKEPWEYVLGVQRAVLDELCKIREQQAKQRIMLDEIRARIDTLAAGIDAL